MMLAVAVAVAAIESEVLLSSTNSKSIELIITTDEVKREVFNHIAIGYRQFDHVNQHYKRVTHKFVNKNWRGMLKTEGVL